MNPKTKKLSNFIRENRFLLILFFLSTAFFIYQHAIYVSWDFASYVLNAKYWFGSGTYFEIFRPPLMPLIIGIFSFLGWKASEFFFIIIASSLFFYSSVRLSRSIKFNPLLFYSISLGIYLMNYGLINGTELLSLAFLELFIALIIENKYTSGLFLGLSTLSRYTSLALFPLILFHLEFKKIAKSLLLFGGVILLWFIYNFYKTGNFFTSIADQYANNILYRQDIVQPFNLAHVITVQNILIPFFILGVILIVYRIVINIWRIKKPFFYSFIKFIDSLKAELIMIILLVFFIESYANIPVKHSRYLFNLVLPTVYFSYVGIHFLISKVIEIGRRKAKVSNRKNESSYMDSLFIKAVTIVSFIFLLLNIILLPKIYPLSPYDPPERYISAIDKINELNMSECTLLSNSWVMINYYGLSCAPSPREELINKVISDREISLLFKRVVEPDYVNNSTFMNSMPIIYENEIYYIIGNTTAKECTPSYGFEKSYLEHLEDYTFKVKGHHINLNPCFILFHNFSFAEKTCNFINLNGFKVDEYRVFR